MKPGRRKETKKVDKKVRKSRRVCRYDLKVHTGFMSSKLFMVGVKMFQNKNDAD